MADHQRSLAETLTQLRHTAELSVRQLEESSGVARSVISRLERGEYRKPSPATLNRLAAALHVQHGDLLAAAGYTANQAGALPSIRPYLRTKYGHLSVGAQAELADFLDRLETEQSSGRSNGESNTK